MLIKRSVLSIFIGTILSTNTYAATDANNNQVASGAIKNRNEVASGYRYTSNRGYLSSLESPYKFKYNPGSDEISYFNPLTSQMVSFESPTRPGSFLGIDGGNGYVIDTSGGQSYYLEGNLVNSVTVKVTDQTTVIIYKNYASDAVISNKNNSTTFLDSNYAAGANVTNEGGSNLYITNNIATSASITSNGSSQMLIKNNDADNATIENSDNSKANIENNSVNNARITNNNAEMLLSYNNASGAIVENKNNGVITASNNKINSNASLTNSTNSTANINNNLVSEANIANTEANMNLSGNNAEKVVLNNQNGVMNLDSNTIKNNSIITNSDDGKILAILNSAANSTFNNQVSSSLQLYGNNIKDSIINNDRDSVLKVGTCTTNESNSCAVAKNTELTGTTINNNGTTFISGAISGTGNVFNNNGSASVVLNGLTAPGVDIINHGHIELLNGQSSNIGNLTNSGDISLSSNGSANNVLYVNGNYIGADGNILFNTQLAGDDSYTNKLVVTGNASGKTYVSFNNLGGNGAQTLEGINIISTGSSTENAFIQKQRIVAGAYDYSLIQGTGDKSGNWYLTSRLTHTDPVVITPTNPVVVTPTDPVVITPTVHKQIQRPEGGSYIANFTAANTLFNTRLYDRLGDTHYIDPLTGENKVTSLWLRQVGDHNHWHNSSDQLKTNSNSYVAQIGGNVFQWSGNGIDYGRLGMMAGYANNKNNTRSKVTGYNSKGSTHGYSVGMYGTWFATANNKAGLYVDSWLQYSWFKNHVNGEQLASEAYNSKGLTASLETGYSIKMAEFADNLGTVNEWFIQPQAQATWMGVKADTHHEHNGTRISSNDSNGNVQTRLGLRTFLQRSQTNDNGNNVTFEPFIEANWLHNTHNFNVKMDDVRINQNGAQNIGEVKVGVEGHLSKNLNLWSNLGVQIGEKDYHDITALIGIKYSFN